MNSTIFDYSTGFPRPQAVIGYDYEKERRLRAQYSTRLSKLRYDCEETEQWVEDIPDSQTRRIFRMYFIDGETYRQIARKMHMDKSTVGRKIDNFLKVAPNAPNAPL